MKHFFPRPHDVLYRLASLISSRLLRLSVLSFCVMGLIAACGTSVSVDDGIFITLIADGRERTYQLLEPMTIDEFLRQSDISLELDNNDRLTPPRYTQISDGMRITIVRVDEEEVCEQAEIPYARETILNEGMAPDEERIMQPGRNGVEEVCYRIVYENGTEQERTRSGQPTLIREPVNELITVGLDVDVEPVPIAGTLSYINNGNAWSIQGDTTQKRALTSEGTLDGKVFDISPDGQYLLYTAESLTGEQDFINLTYVIATNRRHPRDTTRTDRPADRPVAADRQPHHRLFHR